MRAILIALLLFLAACEPAHYEPTDAGCADGYHHYGSTDAASCIPDIYCVETDAGVWCT